MSEQDATWNQPHGWGHWLNHVDCDDADNSPPQPTRHIVKPPEREPAVTTTLTLDECRAIERAEERAQELTMQVMGLPDAIYKKTADKYGQNIPYLLNPYPPRFFDTTSALWEKS